jgi:hypothetical protein
MHLIEQYDWLEYVIVGPLERHDISPVDIGDKKKR